MKNKDNLMLCNVIMLPTKESSKIVRRNSGEKLFFHSDPIAVRQHSEYSNQHLYFTSNEEIKEGDNEWFIGLDNKIYLWNGVIGTYNKIMATIDSSLDLPQVPDSFIEAFVKANGEIKQVNVEMATNLNALTTPDDEWINDYVKTREDNTVIWSLFEEKKYTRDEVLYIAGYASGMDHNTPLEEQKRLVNEQIDKL